MLLWVSNIPMTEDAFRSGAKNAAGTDFLRFADIVAAPPRDGRIPLDEGADFMVNPGHGISPFIKQMLGEGLIRRQPEDRAGAPGARGTGPFREPGHGLLRQTQVITRGNRPCLALPNPQLTPRQIAHTITALRSRLCALEKKGGEDPEGGEYEDILIAESVLKLLMAAGAAANPSDRQD